MSRQDADGMTNSVEHDYIAPKGAVLSGSALFAQTFVPQYLEFLINIRVITSAIVNGEEIGTACIFHHKLFTQNFEQIFCLQKHTFLKTV